MNRTEFETEARAAGYEVGDGGIEPHQHRASHGHGFDVRLLILDGEMTLVADGDRRALRAGDTCSVAAGALHEEHTEAAGVRYVVARRPVAATTG